MVGIMLLMLPERKLAERTALRWFNLAVPSLEERSSLITFESLGAPEAPSFGSSTC